MGFAAVNTGNNLLFLIVSGLLAFMSVTGLAAMLNLQRLTPELLAPPEIYAGTPTPFRLRVHNGKRLLPSFLLRLEVTVPEVVSGESAHCPKTVSEGRVPPLRERGLRAIARLGKQTDDKADAVPCGVTLPVVSAGTSAEGTVTLSFARRGRIGIGRITVSSTFPVNFFNRFWTFSLATTCIVFPRLQPGMAPGDGTETMRLGQTARHRRGLDGELERIAAYSGREPLRMIHWKLSARGDDLLVKEFGSQAAPPLLIDLDSLPGPSLEERIRHAAWLVKRWTGERPVGLKLGERRLPAAAGHRHGLHLLTELALYGHD